MPDILIRGMFFPREGHRVIRIYADGRVEGEHSGITLGVADELPEHGDLIEAEPIKKFITDGLNNKEFGYDAIQVLTEIEYAPVIVPADKEETE